MSHLLHQTLGERLDVGLGGIVDSHEGSGREGCRRRHVQDAALVAGEHARQKQAGERREGRDIQRDHLQLVIDRQFDKGSAQAKAGAVHQHIHVNANVLHGLVHGSGGAAFGEVLRKDVHPYVVLRPQLGSQRLEYSLASCNEHQLSASAARSRAKSRPMPEEAPVTKAVSRSRRDDGTVTVPRGKGVGIRQVRF